MPTVYVVIFIVAAAQQLSMLHLWRRNRDMIRRLDAAGVKHLQETADIIGARLVKRDQEGRDDG